MAVVRVTDVDMLEYQSLIRRSLASGICIMALVASATDCKRHMPMPATTIINSSTTPKPAAKRVPTFQFVMRLSFLFLVLASACAQMLTMGVETDASTGQ